MKNNLIITIDGPAGAGKSTVAVKLAAKLGIAYLDTGAMYRAVTVAALEQQVPLDDEGALAEMVGRCKIEIEYRGGICSILLDGRDVTDKIRRPEVTEKAHYLAKAAAVREQLVRQQQQIGKRLGSLVTEGRDQGTVVFPEAGFKFYLDAAPESRAKRRQEQLQQQGVEMEYQEILDSQKQRDLRDSSRAAGPLKPADDAIVIDTTDMSLEEVVETLQKYVQEKK